MKLAQRVEKTENILEGYHERLAKFETLEPVADTLARLRNGMGKLPPEMLEKLIVRWMYQELHKIELDEMGVE